MQIFIDFQILLPIPIYYKFVSLMCLYFCFLSISRHKSRSELIRISAAVMGIEFSYAAETAFVSPTLLRIGVEHQHMTLVWALSPLVGFFLTPVLGSISDRCRSDLGRRRPFIILLSIGVFLGKTMGSKSNLNVFVRFLARSEFWVCTDGLLSKTLRSVFVA